MTKPVELPSLPRVALFGAGTVGTVVTALLQRSGCAVDGVWSRSPSSVERARELLAAPALEPGMRVDADLIVIGAGDPGIGDVGKLLLGTLRTGAVVAHLSGASGIAPLQPLITEGAHGLAAHPVQACPTIEAALERLPGSAWGVTATEGIEDWAATLIREKLHGEPVTVAEEHRPLWHAASAMTSNGIAALMAFGESILATIGIEDPAATLGPLASGTVANARAGGGGGRTLTGPVVRGEIATIERHIRNLKEHAPDLLDDYVRVVRTILSAARSAGRIDDATCARIEEAIGP
jgi:predicted short-subunit dehydrogenase-like oxidoreductase (DUF2520 family)